MDDARLLSAAARTAETAVMMGCPRREVGLTGWRVGGGGEDEVGEAGDEALLAASEDEESQQGE